MPLAPEAAVGPLAEAPPDRPTMGLEQLLRQLTAILFSDRVLDMNERQLLYGFFQEVQVRAANGGIGMGGTPPSEAAADPGMDPLGHNTEDMGTIEGAQPEYEEAY